MRNVWDEKKLPKDKALACQQLVLSRQGPAVFLKSRKAFVKQMEEAIAKTKKYFFEHLKLKRAVIDFFPDYQRYLGEAGFTKI